MRHLISGITSLFISTIILTCDLYTGNYYVGPSREYKELSDVRIRLSPGDTVFVDGDAIYPGGINFSRPGTPENRIVIIGVRINNNRPVIDGGTNAVAFINGADHYTFEGFEVRNAAFRGVYHQSNDLILRDLLIHNCNNGIMGADNGSGSLLLEYSEIHSCGSGDRAHQIYMATDEITHPGSVFRMQFCWIHDGAGGNNVKSRAERNEIYYNWIENGYYHELELIGPDPVGGVPADLKREDSDVVGNVFRKRNNFYVFRVGGDGTGETYGRYRFVNNTMLMGTSAVFRIFHGIESVEMHNNIIIRPGSGNPPVVRTVEARWKDGEQIHGSNNYVEAGLTNVPIQWTETRRGDENIFNDMENDDLSPLAGSQIINTGTLTPETPEDYRFPSPLFPPEYLPPKRELLLPGTAMPRYAHDKIDIGAYEYVPATGASDNNAVPAAFYLDQNYPNPFNPTTSINYQLAESGHITLIVYDLLGREVVTLINENKTSGKHTVEWNGRNSAGHPVGNGIYFYKLQTEHGLTSVKSMVLIK